MIPIRLRQASLLLFAMLISVVAFYQMFLRVYGHFPANYIGLLAVVGALFLVLWGLLLRFKPYASQAISAMRADADRDRRGDDRAHRQVR